MKLELGYPFVRWFKRGRGNGTRKVLDGSGEISIYV